MLFKTKKPNQRTDIDADAGEGIEKKNSPFWAVIVSWFEIYFFQAIAEWVVQLLLMFLFLTFSDFMSLNIALRCFIFLIGAPTVLGIFFAPLGYGVMFSVGVSEALAPSPKSARYIVFATYIALKHVYSLYLYNAFPEYYGDLILLNIQSIYMVIYGIILGMTGMSMNES